MSYNWYIENELEPALAWADSQDGRNFIRCFGPKAFYNLLYNQRDEILEALYMITFKGVPLYIGEAVKPYKRWLVHLWHMRFEPELYFGLVAAEVENISFSILRHGISDSAERKAAELELRAEYCPILNPAELGNHCRSKAARYDAVHKWFNNPAKLNAAIDFVVNSCPWVWGWREAIHQTPCFKPSEDKISYGLPRRIEECLERMPKAERRSVYRTTATQLGGYNVTARTVITCLAQILDGVSSLDELQKMAIQAAMIQTKIRLDFIKSMDCSA